MKLKLAFYIALLSIFPSISQEISEGLLLNYEFNGNTTDIINSYDAENFGAIYGIDRFGNENSAVYFDGIDDYINFPNIDELKPDLPISFSFFVKYDNLSYEDSTVFNTSFEEDINTGVYMNIQSSTGKYQISYGDGSNFYNSNSRRTYTSNSIVDPDEWHHIVITVNSEFNMKIYVDCVELGGDYSGAGGSLQYSNFEGVIGRHDRSLIDPADYFKGAVDDFMFWNRELTANEILTLCTSLSVNDEIAISNNVQIIPNPSTGKFKIGNIVFDTMSVYDNLGKLVLKKGYDEEIDMTDFNKGLYFLKLTRGNSVVTKKIILK